MPLHVTHLFSFCEHFAQLFIYVDEQSTHVDDVFNKTITAQAITELKNAGISEKIGFINYLSVCLFNVLSDAVLLNNALKALAFILKTDDLTDATGIEFAAKLKTLLNEQHTVSYSKAENVRLSKMLRELSDETEASTQEVKECISRYVTSQIGNLKKIVKTGQNYLSNCAEFMFNTLGDSPEFKIFVSNVTTNSISASFLINFGCREFAAYSDIQYDQKDLLNELEVHFK